MFGNVAFELKITKLGYLNFDRVKPHQIRNLRLAKKRLIWKIPDDSRGEKPFDCFQLRNAEAYIVIMYYKRGQKEFVVIEVDTFVNEKETSTRKSLTEERAKEIGIICIL